MDKSNKPFSERLPEFREKLVELCKKYRIEVISTVIPTPTSILTGIQFIDLDDPKMMEKYGLEEISQKNTPSSLLTN